MTVNGWRLPDSFVALIDRPKPLGYWIPKEGVDQFPPLRQEAADADDDGFVDDLELCKDLATIEKKTSKLPVYLRLGGVTEEDIAGWTGRWAHLPGFISYITDFSKIVCFGNDGESAPYCFDYRDNPDEPSVIHWNDAYWRRMAPSFDTFISWFEPLDGDGP